MRLQPPQCAECQRLRHELAAIDVDVQGYARVRDNEDPQSARRQAVRTVSSIERRLEQLLHYELESLRPPPAESSRRSSLRTLMDLSLRGRWWLALPLSWALLLLGGAVTWFLIKR